MPLFSRGPSIPSGWVQAPGDVQAEIFLVWQEDELPDELKNSPGYVPFTLSPGAEQWVRGMAEVKEIDGPKEKLVIGRPRPAAQIQHRPLIADAGPASPSPPPSNPTWQPSPPAWETPVPLWEPNMAAKEWIRRQAPRAAPAIEIRGQTAPASIPNAPQQTAPHAPPSIGASAQTEPVDTSRASTPKRVAPDIGGERYSEQARDPDPAPRAATARSLPQIGGGKEPAPDSDPDETLHDREKPRSVPDIGAP